MKKIDTKKISAIGMFCALAFISMVMIKIPVVLFLKYEPKDVIITVCGLIYGPIYSFVVSLIVSFIEMITVSDTGIIGFVMNVLSTVAFACTASYIYKKGKTIKSAVIGLCTGVVLMTIIMILWNYIMTPIYMGQSRADIAAMLAPVFLPFNLLKGSINAALTYLLYKPVIKILRTAKLAPPSENQGERKTNMFMIVACLVVLATGILIILAYNGII